VVGHLPKWPVRILGIVTVALTAFHFSYLETTTDDINDTSCHSSVCCRFSAFICTNTTRLAHISSVLFNLLGSTIPSRFVFQNWYVSGAAC